MSKIIKAQEVVNPFGKGSMAVSLKPIVENLYKFYLNIKGDISISFFKSKDTYVFFLTIPSKRNDKLPSKLRYEVVLGFYPTNKENYTADTILNYGLRVFSNSPSFLYGFTYVFNKHNALVSFIPKKYYSKLALTEPPKERNPKQLLGIEETIWISLFHIYQSKYYNKSFLDRTAVELDKSKLLGEISTQEQKLKESENLEKRYKYLKDLESRKDKKKKSASKTGGSEKRTKNDRETLSFGLTSSMKTELSGNMSSSMKTTMKREKEEGIMKNTSLKSNPLKR